MGCFCCKSRPSPSDAIINTTALLTESTIKTKNPINPLLQVYEDKVKYDAIAMPKLIPDIRQLQSIIFGSLHTNEYDLYPKYSKFASIWNSVSIETEKLDICNKLFQISLTISLYTNGANESLYINMYNLLDYSIRVNHSMILLPDLVQLIISFMSGICFSDDIRDERKRKQLQFTYNNNIVTFNNNIHDYLNIRSQQPLVGDKILINCHVRSKGDEMWIGLVHDQTFGIVKEIEKSFGSLLYYGGREQSINNKLSNSKWDNGLGAIHGFGKVIETIEYYRSNDWISFLIDTNKQNPKCKMFKNGNEVFQINSLPFKSKAKKSKINDEKEDNIYFCVVVDEYMDCLIVEQVLYT